MRRSLPIVLALAYSLLAAFVHGKTADDFFHQAANLYVQGRLQEAGNEVEQGLSANPGDAKLSGLASLLKQLKDQQRQDQNQQGGGQKSDSQEDKQDNPEKNGQGSKDQEDKQDSTGSGKNQPKPDKPDEPKADSSQSEQGGQADSSQSPKDQGQDQQPAKAKPGQMSKEDAERLLNSFENDEKQSQKDRQAPRRKVDVEEDW